jgi:hypothetical protein
MGWYERLKYDVNVMARLRFPMPDRDEREVLDEEREEVYENRRAFVEHHLDEVENQIVEVVRRTQAGDGIVGSTPEPLVEELAWVGQQLSMLETYRDRLIVFARTLASETVPARTIGRSTSLSHSTIVRMVTPEAIADIASEASAAAYAALHSGWEPRDDPEFYLRLNAALVSTPEGEDAAQP